MGQMEGFVNGPQLNFFYSAQLCLLILTHNFNWPAIEGKYMEIAERVLLPSI